MSPDRHNHHIVIIPDLGDPRHGAGALSHYLSGLRLPTHVFAYAWREWTIDRAALMLATFVDCEVIEGDDVRSVSLVGLGVGSLILRYFLSHYELLPARRCVIVADPFHPSDTYRSKRSGWLARWRYGAMLPQLVEGPGGFPSNCGVPPIPFGVMVTGVALPEGTDRYDNEFVSDSIYTPRHLLAKARDVQYEPTRCTRAPRKAHVCDLVGTFLLHGWFVEN
jgi:hypothetical protein